RARELLRSRLTRRGLVLSASALALELSRSAATAAVPAALSEGTTRAALLFAAGTVVAGGRISTEAAALAAGGLKAMTLTQGKLSVFGALFVGLLGLSAGPLGQLLLVAQTPAAESDAKASQAPAEKATLKDQHGDPLPPGALARLGTVRWRHGGLVLFAGFLADGKGLVTAASDGMARVWEVDSGRELRRFGKEDLSPELITLSANGKVLAAASMDGNRVVPLPAQRAGEKAQKMVQPGFSS